LFAGMIVTDYGVTETGKYYIEALSFLLYSMGKEHSNDIDSFLL